MIFWFLCITTCHVWKYLVFSVMLLLCSAILSQDLLSWPNASLIFLFVLLDECMDFHKNAVITKTNSSSIYFAILLNAWSIIFSLECFFIFDAVVMVIRLAWSGIEHSSLVIEILVCMHWLFNRFSFYPFFPFPFFSFYFNKFCWCFGICFIEILYACWWIVIFTCFTG